MKAGIKQNTITYLEPTQEAGRELFSTNNQGPVVMLNLLRFREIADYSANPELAPENDITGEQAYQRYTDYTQPFLQASGGEVLFYGRGGSYFIGPSDEYWDAALLVKQASLQAFLSFATNPEYAQGLGHRTAALVDSRLLPLFGDEPR